MDLSAAYALVRDDLAKVETNLAALVTAGLSCMEEPLKHVLSDRGKRLRPAVTLLSGKVYPYDPEMLLPMATATELLHTATLVHDDTIDRSQMRRGKPTVNNLWGNSIAVLLGDYLFATSAEMVSSTGNVRVMRLFAQTLMSISSGELGQVFSIYDWKQSRDHYYQRIASKTASLFAMATESGAALSQAPEEAVQALRVYGHNLGICFQIADDILDFVGDEAEMGKPVGSDLMQGTLTLPAILLLEHYPNDNPVKSLFENKGDRASLERAIDMVRNSKILPECYTIAGEFCQRACQELDKLPTHPNVQALRDLSNFAIQRRK